MLQDCKSHYYLSLMQWSKKGKDTFSILLYPLQIIDIFSLLTKDKICISINLLKLLSQDFKSLEYFSNSDIELASVSFKKKSEEKHSVPPDSIISRHCIFFLNHVLLVLKNILYT